MLTWILLAVAIVGPILTYRFGYSVGFDDGTVGANDPQAWFCPWPWS